MRCTPSGHPADGRGPAIGGGVRRRVVRLTTGLAVAAAGILVVVPGSPARAATCTPAGSTGFTAAVVATAGQTISNQTVDATGCDLGIYVGPTASGVTISDTTVSGANDHGIMAEDATNLAIQNSTIENNGLNPTPTSTPARQCCSSG